VNNRKRGKRKKKKAYNGLKTVIVLCSIALLILFIFLLKISLLSYNWDAVFIENVLLHLNNNYLVSVDDNRVLIQVKNLRNIKNVFVELERAVYRENGVIYDYNLEKYKGEQRLELLIKYRRNLEKTFQFVVQRRDPEQDFIQVSKPLQEKPSEIIGRICIIIDDAGYNNPQTHDYARLPIKIGIAVLPCLSHSKSIATMIFKNGKEVLMHMPMEPEEYEKREIKLMPEEILTTMKRIDIYRTMDKMLATVPFAKGINNHQGSQATSDRYLMRSVLDKVKKHKMYFIDSLTSKKSLTRQMAEKMQVNYSTRDIFLDNKDEYHYIKKQMEKLINISLKHGKAIGIGHIGKINTYRVIKEYIPCIRSRGIELVYPSEIIDKFYDKEV